MNTVTTSNPVYKDWKATQHSSKLRSPNGEVIEFLWDPKLSSLIVGIELLEGQPAMDFCLDMLHPALRKNHAGGNNWLTLVRNKSIGLNVEYARYLWEALVNKQKWTADQ